MGKSADIAASVILQVDETEWPVAAGPHHLRQGHVAV
jgi:hypothetical protein